MKLTMLIAAFACLELVTAHPLLTGRTTRSLLKRGAKLLWDPANAYENQQKLKTEWERTCDDILTRAGCDAGTIHLPRIQGTRDGQETYYVNVEGASSMDEKRRKKMRVFHDGSAEDVDDWPMRDKRKMAEAKRKHRTLQPQRDLKTLLSWDPPGIYKEQRWRKSYWEQRCDEVLFRAGCKIGTIHQPQIRRIRDGQTTFYVNVEGASSEHVENPKRMRVFQDGSAEDVDEWPGRDRQKMTAVKRKYKSLQPQMGPKTLLSWNPPDAYKDQTVRRSFWEQNCDEALARAGCRIGIMHQGEIKLIRKGRNTSYLNVEGAPSADLMENPKKMRVFQDGSSEDVKDWSKRDFGLMREAKRRPMKDDLQPQKNPKALLFWNPAHTYQRRRQKKEFWERQCDVALAREGCDGGIIHAGESTLIGPNGEQELYVHVETAPSVGTEHGKKMRVYQNGSSEVVGDWTVQERKRMRDSTPRRRRLVKTVQAGETNTSPRAPTEEPAQNHPELKISWDPPKAYWNYNRFRHSFERACHSALEREGCDADFAIIHKGYRKQDNADGTKSNFMIVAAGKRNDPGTKKYMRLFEDGSSSWYPPGPLPKYDARGGRGVNLNPLLSVPYQRKRGRPRLHKEKISGTQTQGASADTPTPTQEENSQEPTQDSSKRRRVGEVDYQYAEAQAGSPRRFEAPGADGGPRRFGLDLNSSPPAEAASSPEPSHTPIGGE